MIVSFWEILFVEVISRRLFVCFWVDSLVDCSNCCIFEITSSLGNLSFRCCFFEFFLPKDLLCSDDCVVALSQSHRQFANTGMSLFCKSNLVTISPNAVLSII